MKADRVTELIEKLVEEKLRLAAVLNSKTLGENKEFFLVDCRKKIGQIKSDLYAALQSH